MGKLGEDMERLSQEIRALRRERQSTIRVMRVEVAELRQGFREEHAEMARTSMAQRRAILDDLAQARRAWAELGTAPVDPLTDPLPEPAPQPGKKTRKASSKKS